jgi:1-acyl-sn-glycerol-3-phosphate acyltransferase
VSTSQAQLDTPAGAEDQAALLIALARELVEQTRPDTRGRLHVTLASNIDRDLGLDSLARVELGLRVERALDARLPEGAAATAENLGDLLGALRSAGNGANAKTGVAPTARSEEPDAVVGEPDDARTLIEMLDWHVTRRPDRLEVTFLATDMERQTLTHGDLAARARRVAAGLVAAGLAPRQACALMLPTSLEFFATYYGILMAGGIPVPIYPPFRMSQIEDHLRRQAGILANCEARVLVTVPEAKLVARLLRGDVPTLRHVVTPAELAVHGNAFTPVETAPDDIAFLQYTSGSTGNPKGVVLTHAHLLANIRAMGRAAQATSRDVFVSWLPLYHDMGLIGAWLTTLYFSVPLVLMSPLAFLSRPSRWLRAIHDYRGTLSAAPNFAYELVASRIDEREIEGIDLSSWRWAFNGAEAINAQTMKRFAARLAPHGLDPLTLAPVYGLAEVALCAAFPATRRGMLVDAVDRDILMDTGRARPVEPTAPGAQQIVACGRALPGYELRTADAKGNALGERTVGRVEVRGPSVTSGYYRNTEATAGLFDGEWLDTGDLGYLAAGELHITGRAKDMIIRGGHNIYPYELEEAAGALPGVRRGCVAVFGASATDGSGERLVVLAETRVTDEAERERLRGRINDLSVELVGGPADVIVLAPPHSVLKTSSGKLRRAATRELYERGLVGAGKRAVWWQLTRLAARGLAGRVRHAIGDVLDVVAGIWAWLVFGGIAIAGLIGTVVIPGLRTRQAASRALARFAAAAIGVRVTAVGTENLPREGSIVAVANHSTYLDAIVMMAALPVDIVFIAKAELAESWLMRRLLTSVGTRFVERFDAARSAEDARDLTEAARSGTSFAFFPEGTFVRAPGLLEFRMGAFVLAAESGIPIVPIAIAGTRALMPAGSWLPRRGPVRVVVGAPIAPSGSEWNAAIRLRDAARTHILAHCGEPDLAGARIATVLRPQP